MPGRHPSLVGEVGPAAVEGALQELAALAGTLRGEESMPPRQDILVYGSFVRALLCGGSAGDVDVTASGPRLRRVVRRRAETLGWRLPAAAADALPMRVHFTPERFTTAGGFLVWTDFLHTGFVYSARDHRIETLPGAIAAARQRHLILRDGPIHYPFMTLTRAVGYCAAGYTITHGTLRRLISLERCRNPFRRAAERLALRLPGGDFIIAPKHLFGPVDR